MTELHSSFGNFFSDATKSPEHPGGHVPRGWQGRLGADPQCRSRLIRIPTGEGKTLGALGAWVFHRIVREDASWPRRLVWCLPMRTLVEQTVAEAERLLERLELTERVAVHALMGGCDERRWYHDPVQPAILVGTQDMLLSRALNRGYAMGRAAWPRAFGLLNSDALWVMDEVQLMGVGLTSSCQIQSFFDAGPGDAAVRKPRATWWMSATLQPDWLKTPDTHEMVSELAQQMLVVNADEQAGEPWQADKPIKRIDGNAKDWAGLVVQQHTSSAADPQTGKQTLVVLNTVAAARGLYETVSKHFAKQDDGPEVCLIHSRFRPAEREQWVDRFLSRASLTPRTDRILIATQVVEAGVDISATCLMTELAPWPSLVQRFGRAARYGGSAKVVVLDPQHADDRKAAPYQVVELDAAREAIDKLTGVSIADLQAFEQRLSGPELGRLYPYDPVHVLLRSEFEELFDTSPDLSGADVDVTRFIREGDDRNVVVLWRFWDGSRPSAELRPQRRELCSVPIADAKKWLAKVERKHRWAWDYLDGDWVFADSASLRPGQIVLVHSAAGGYDPEVGFTGSKPGKVSVPDARDSVAVDSEGDFAEASEDLSAKPVWKTICTHCGEAAVLAAQRCEQLGVPASVKRVVVLALRLHDWGKAHPAFASGTYRVTPLRTDLAKAPDDAWPTSPQRFYRTDSHGPRRGFRHELASGLAVLEVLRRSAPLHEGVLGAYQGMLSACGLAESLEPESDAEWADHPLAGEIQQLSATEFNLLLYLVISHHGKVRCSLQSSPLDQDFPVHEPAFAGRGMPVRGVREGDELPATQLPAADGSPVKFPAVSLSIDIAAMGLSARYGASWTERMQGLLDHYGPFQLAWLEALVRAIDGRASDERRPPGSEPDGLIDTQLSVPPIEPDPNEQGRSAESENDRQPVPAEEQVHV